MRGGLRARSSRPAGLGYEAAAAGHVHEAGAGEVEFRPVQAIVDHLLSAGGEKGLPLRLAQAEVVADALFQIGNARLALGSDLQQGQQEGLIVGNGHRQPSAAGRRPRRALGAAPRSARMRSSSTLAGSSAGSCGTSSPRKAFASTA